jgi:hypothetical protein
MVKEYLGTGQVERHQVVDDAYIGTIEKISDVYKTKGYKGEEKEQLRIEIILESGVTLPLFVTAVVSYPAEKDVHLSPSKLYRVLIKAGEFDAYYEARDNIYKPDTEDQEKNRNFVAFLRKHLEGRKVQAQTKTVRSSGGEQYSVVSDIVSFVTKEKDATISATTPSTAA